MEISCGHSDIIIEYKTRRYYIRQEILEDIFDR